MYKFAVGDVLVGKGAKRLLFLVLEATNFSYTCFIVSSRFPEITSKVLVYKMKFIEEQFVLYA